MPMLNDNDTMKLYMRHISRYPLITPDDEAELAAEIKKGSEAARQKLIRSNLRLVVKIAHDFKGYGLPLLDLISEGNMGLMLAVEKFDPAKGAKLSSYAAWWIKQSMRRALANQSRTIRIPIQSATKINKIQRAKDKLRKEWDREPTNAEIAREVDLTERTVTGLGLVRTTMVSLHDPIQQGEDGEFRDIIPDENTASPEETVESDEMLRHMLELVDRLSDREQRILKLRFGLGGEREHTLVEVSQIIGRTRERIRQIQNQALTKLKQMLYDEAAMTEAAETVQELSAIA